MKYFYDAACDVCRPARVRNYKFTGKERDAESGLDNFGKRYHASTMGRFMTPDPIMIMKQKLTDPQQWNMYSYSRNNPLRFMDPTGMYATDCGSLGAKDWRVARPLTSRAQPTPVGCRPSRSLRRAGVPTACATRPALETKRSASPTCVQRRCSTRPRRSRPSYYL